MTGLLDLRRVFVRQQVEVLRLTGVYELVDPGNGLPVGVAKDEPPGWAKWLRLLIERRILPTVVRVYEGFEVVVTLRKSWGLLRPTVAVENAEGRPLGTLRAKVLTIGGGFVILDGGGQPVGDVQGDWIGWDFQIRDARGGAIGKVTKKWAGAGREFFTSADHYMIELPDTGGRDRDHAALLLAAALAIDLVFKSGK